MKLKVNIAGPKVHDVGYRYFLMSMAMSNRIRKFEAHNIESSDCEEVLVFVDGDDDAVKAFRDNAKAKRPARSEVSNIIFGDFEGDVMKIGEYAQFCSTVQLNKAIPLLLDMRDDLKAVRKNTDMIPQISEDIKAVRKTTEALQKTTEAVQKTTEATLGEIKGLREDIQPGYASNFRQIQADVRAIKDRLGML
jgi:hypothetical protein